MSLSFVECEAARLPSLRAFFRRLYRSSYRLAMDEELLDWQYRAPDNGVGPCHVKLAVSEGEIRACLGYIPVEFSVVGRSVRAAWTANLMVDPPHRRLGLGPLLLRQLTAEFDAVLAIGLTPEASDLLPRMGWIDFGDLARYVCVLDVGSAARLTESGTLEWPSVPAHAGCVPGSSFAQALLGEDVTELWDRVWGRRGAGTRRTVKFLNWRYAAHPRFQYRILTLRSSRGSAEGFAVYRVEQLRELPVKIGRIVELVTELGAASSLIRSVASDARAAGVAVLDFFCSSRLLEEPLIREGFLRGDAEPASKIPLVFQPIDRNRAGIRFMADVSKLANAVPIDDWYVTSGDGDQDRPN